jgi:mannose-6-phosphate isomerase-like protein (cupin superfamily)
VAFTLTKSGDVFRISKHSINLQVYKDIGDCGIVLIDTDEGHNQEFVHGQSTFHYIVLEGTGTFYVNSEAVSVSTGDLLSIEPSTRIYYTGRMRLLLITNPPWREENEAETKAKVW